MTNKIFISQGTLELSRNRAERRLNAILDNQDKLFIPNLKPLDTGEVDNSHTDLSLFQASPVNYQVKQKTKTSLSLLDTGEAGNFGSDTIFTSFPSPVNYNHPNIQKFLKKWGLDYL